MQAKAAASRPAAPQSSGGPGARSSVIQRYITYDQNWGFSRDGGRPGGHSNLGVLAKILKDIIKKGALTDVESELLSVTTKFGTAQAKAKHIKSNAVLSGQGFAVCHKIPYAAFEKALLKLIDDSFVHGVGAKTMAPAWNALDGLLNVLYGTPNGNYDHGGALRRAVGKFNPDKTVTEANDLLREFDKCDENLYVGFSMTNSSIGERVDLHFPVLTTATDAVAATPRGAGLQQALNRFESALGLTPTGPHEYVDSSNVTWLASSSVYGKISADTGYVQT